MLATMKPLLFSFVLLAAAFSSGVCEKARFDNYRVYRLTPRTEMEVVQLLQISNAGEFDFWNEPMNVDMPVSIMVAPHQRVQFDELLREYSFENELTIENVQSLIDAEEVLQRDAPTRMEWSRYHNLKDIYDWLDELANKYSNVSIVIGGRSYEDRQIKGIEINFGKNLPGVVIESGIHAREWISAAGTSWMINEILKSPSNSVFRQFNYLYFPLLNPDGYVFSWEKNRMWRKTRTPYKSGSRMCYGADPNRNWGSHWNEGGSSNDPCTETYAGPKAFSEVETRTFANYMTSVAKKRNNDIYIAYHSYSQLLMFPWGYTSRPAKENALWQRIGNRAAADLEAVHGTRFRVGPIFTTIYQVSGTSIEWYYDALNATIPFVYEMRDKGQYGFVLPANQIIPSGQEHLASLQTILKEYKNLKK